MEWLPNTLIAFVLPTLKLWWQMTESVTRYSELQCKDISGNLKSALFFSIQQKWRHPMIITQNRTMSQSRGYAFTTCTIYRWNESSVTKYSIIAQTNKILHLGGELYNCCPNIRNGIFTCFEHLLDKLVFRFQLMIFMYIYVSFCMYTYKLTSVLFRKLVSSFVTMLVIEKEVLN